MFHGSVYQGARGADWWFEADDNVTLDGGNHVIGLGDKTPNHYDVVPANAGTNPPPYNFTSTNGLPGITFSAQLNSSALHNPTQFYAQGTPRTALAVVKMGGRSSQNTLGGGIIAYRRNFPAFICQLITFDPLGSPTQRVYSDGVSVSDPVVTPVDYSGRSLRLKWIFNGTTVQIYIGGVLIAQTGTAVGPESGSAGFILGNNIDDDGGQEFEGDLNSAISLPGNDPTMIAEYEAFQIAKWGV
jgi:hypothetical protein